MRAHRLPWDGGFTHCYPSRGEDWLIRGKVDEEGSHAVCLKRPRWLMEFLSPQLLKSVWERGGLMESALSETSTATKLEKCTKPWVSAGYRLNIDWVREKNIAQCALCTSHHLIKDCARDNRAPLSPSSRLSELVMPGIIIYHFMALWRNGHNSAWKPALIIIYKNKVCPCLRALGIPTAGHSHFCLLMDDPLREMITNSVFAVSPDLSAATLFNYSFLVSALHPYLGM